MANEKLNDKDKVQHFVVCLLAGLVNPWLAVGLALGKEYGDKNATGNHWCWWDLLADAIGTLIGGTVHVLVRIFAIGA